MASPDEFLAFVNSDDELTMVLKSHCVIESVLRDVVGKRIPKVLRDDYRIGFLTLVDIAASFDRVDPETRPVFEALNKLRVRFAHHWDAALSEADADRLEDVAKVARLPAFFASESRGSVRFRVAAIATSLWAHVLNRGVYEHSADELSPLRYRGTRAGDGDPVLAVDTHETRIKAPTD